MAKISDKCLRGNIQQNADTDIEMMANCHCTDYRSQFFSNNSNFSRMVSVRAVGLEKIDSVKPTVKI